MVDRQHPSLSSVRQCALLGVSRAGIYYRQHLETSFFQSKGDLLGLALPFRAIACMFADVRKQTEETLAERDLAAL